MFNKNIPFSPYDIYSRLISLFHLFDLMFEKVLTSSELHQRDTTHLTHSRKSLQRLGVDLKEFLEKARDEDIEGKI